MKYLKNNYFFIIKTNLSYICAIEYKKSVQEININNCVMYDDLQDVI